MTCLIFKLKQDFTLFVTVKIFSGYIMFDHFPQMLMYHFPRVVIIYKCINVFLSAQIIYGYLFQIHNRYLKLHNL